MNGTELRSFSHFQILTKIAYMNSRNLQIDKIMKFFLIYCKAVIVSQNDQIRIQA